MLATPLADQQLFAGENGFDEDVMADFAEKLVKSAVVPEADAPCSRLVEQRDPIARGIQV